jgi:hypothetical protein
MTIELSNLTFTEQDDIVPMSGVEEIINTGIANTLAGNDTITSIGTKYKIHPSIDILGTGFHNIGTLNTVEGNDRITGIHRPNQFEPYPDDPTGLVMLGVMAFLMREAPLILVMVTTSLLALARHRRVLVLIAPFTLLESRTIMAS